MPLWDVSVNQLPEGITPLERLDLTGLLHSPAEVNTAARSALIDLASGVGACGGPYQFILALGPQGGELYWDAKVTCHVYFGSSAPRDMGCEMPDSDLSNMTCKG